MRRAAFCVLCLLPLPAAAEVLASNPTQILEQIREYGHKAKLAEGENGVPYIEAEGDGFIYWVDFYSCEGGINCRDIQFNASFDVTKTVPDSFLAEWGSNWALGAVHASDDGDAVITHYIIMPGGLPEETMQATISQWTALLETFQTELYR